MVFRVAAALAGRASAGRPKAHFMLRAREQAMLHQFACPVNHVANVYTYVLQALSHLAKLPVQAG